MSKPKILIVGAGGHARSCIDVIEKEGRFSICGLVDASLPKDSEVMGYPILGDDKILEALKNVIPNALIGVGQIKTPKIRISIYDRLMKLGYNLPTIISPLAYIASKVALGEGNIIMHHAFINVNTKIGKCCIINSKALIEHDSIIGDFCHLSTASVVNGNCLLGDRRFIGSNMVLKHQTKVACDSVVYANYLEKNIVCRGGGG